MMASPGYVLPWDPSYTSTSNPVPADVVLPWIQPAPTPAPAAPIPGSVPVVISGASTQAVEDTLIRLAENAIRSAGPELQHAVEGFVVNELGKVLSSSPPPSPPVLDSDVLTKAAARDRAIRSLLYGMGLSALWGMSSAVASAGGVDWFTKNGLLTVGSMVVVTAGHAVLSYIGRIKWSPRPPVGLSTPVD